MSKLRNILTKAGDDNIVASHRCDAIKELAELGESDPQAREAFLDLPLDGDVSVRRAYLKLLSKLEEEIAIPKLFQFLESETDDYLLKNIIEDIRDFNNPIYAGKLIPLANHKNRSVSAIAKDAVKTLNPSMASIAFDSMSEEKPRDSFCLVLCVFIILTILAIIFYWLLDYVEEETNVNFLLVEQVKYWEGS